MTPLLADELTAPIGYRADGTPIRLHAGGDWSGMTAEPDEGPDEETGEEPEEDEEVDEEPDDSADAYTPPSKDEWERVQAGVRRNNQENKQLRLLKKQLTGKGVDLSTDEGREAFDNLLNGRTSGDAGESTSSKRDVDRAVARAAERAAAKVEGKLKPALAAVAVEAALAKSGWSGKDETLPRLMKMIDMDEIDVDDDGKVVGIADQIADIKRDIPEWFRSGQKPAGEKRGGASEVDAGDKKTKSGAQKTWLEKVNDSIAG